MGVADMTSISAPAPFSPSALRWATPKRCCSSQTQKASAFGCTSACSRACVPTATSISPAASARLISRFSLAGVEPARKATRISGIYRRTRAKFCAASTSVGAIIAA